MEGQILIIGATGSVGSELVSLLIQSGARVRAASREPAAAKQRSTSQIEFVEFDFERPQTFASALDGVDRVFLIARPGDEHPERAAIPLIDEMKRQGVRHAVNLSAMGVETRNDIGLRRVELYVEDSGIGFTHLRPNFFMQVFSSGPLLADIRLTGAIHIPAAAAKLSYVDVRDIAAVAAAALTGQDHVGKVYTITGGQSLDHYQIAETISEAAHRAVQYVPISEEIAQRNLSAAGFSPERVERLIGFYRLVRDGFCAPISDDVEKVLGRPPISIAQFARDNASCWI
jgi:uncharacterized protein YbjT (DUF2867 family)